MGNKWNNKWERYLCGTVLLSSLLLQRNKSSNGNLVILGIPGSSDSKESAVVLETQVWSLYQEDALEKGVATHSSICLENSMDRGEEPGKLESLGSQKVTHSTEQLSLVL